MAETTIVDEQPQRSNRGSGNNNPPGRNQYSGGVMDMARDRPMAAAAVAAGAAAAGAFPMVEAQPDQRSAEQPQRSDRRMARRHGLKQQ